MKKICLLLMIAVLFTIPGNTCTTFFINYKGQLVFGRNYDWITDAGMICTNLRGLSKTSMKTSDGNTTSWIAKYGSITFNQYGKEFPTGGMNEKGLVVELMWLDGTQYPTADDRPALGVLQWIQYQLDNCSDIEEVIASDKLVRIASKGTTPLHYLVADAKGNAATIEFFEGKMMVHKGEQLPFPVLTNNTYESSVAIANNTGTLNNSLERFRDACKLVNSLQQTNTDLSLTDYSFNILDRVSQGSFTKWSIVYDITNKKISFRSNRYRDVKEISFAAFDFACNASAKSWDMNQTGAGIVSNLFETFTLDLNRRIVEKAFEESNERIQASPASVEANWKYAGGSICPLSNRQ